MSDKPTKAQIKELWEGCGFKKTRLQSGNMGWLYPPEYSLELGYLPPIDLNNLFEFAVPFLIKEYGEEAEDAITNWLIDTIRYSRWGKEAEYLFWVLRQVLKEESNE